MHPCRSTSTTKHEILITERETTDYTVDGVAYQVITGFAKHNSNKANTDFNFIFQDQVDLFGNVIKTSDHCGTPVVSFEYANDSATTADSGAFADWLDYVEADNPTMFTLKPENAYASKPTSSEYVRVKATVSHVTNRDSGE